MDIRIGAVLLAAVLGLVAPGQAAAQSARDLYARTLAQERVVRDVARQPTLRQLRNVVAAYERIVHRYPRSGYSDNALWQAGNLCLLAYERFGEAADKRTGIRLLTLLKRGYPSSSLVARVPAALAGFDASRAAPPPPRRASSVPAAPPPIEPAPPPASEDVPSPDPDAATIRNITRTPLGNGVRVSIEMDREPAISEEQLHNPRRLFFDLAGAQAAPALVGATMRFTDGVVREIRLGRHPNNTTRVVFDTEGVESHSVFVLYSPFRLIIDFRQGAGPLPASAVPISTTGPAGDARPAVAAASPPLAPLPSRPVTTGPGLPAPAVPAVNSNGKFSISRQLGLGVSRIVIDPGHGGHDPGATANGLSESALTLDVGLRLKKLLAKHPGIEVVMTRETNVFIPLEERTAIANREGADLFLSIHANASRNTNARGVETYFLNFATNPAAEAVAARENSASGRTMHSLPSIVRAIALNNKIDESRDFAATVQKSMVRRLAQKNGHLRDLGVKQAPFVVLIGAGMPSVLAEISFLTNKQESQLLKTGAYRQTIAEALQDAVLAYQRSLKVKNVIAARE